MLRGCFMCGQRSRPAGGGGREVGSGQIPLSPLSTPQGLHKSRTCGSDVGHAGHIARVILDRAERAVRSEEAECQHPGQCTLQPGKWTGLVQVVLGTLGLGCAIPFSASSTCELGYTQRTRQGTGFVFLSPASEQASTPSSWLLCSP